MAAAEGAPSSVSAQSTPILLPRAAGEHLVLDLSHVPYISSAGLRAIHTVYMLLRDADTNEAANAVQGIAHGTYKSPHLKLVKPSKNALKALSTAGYDMFLEIHDSIPAAVQSFK